MSHAPDSRKEDTPEDQALALYREELKKRFPLPQPKPPRKKRVPAVVTSALLLAGTALGLAWLDPAYRIESYSVSVGQRQTIELADGSQIKLDSASRLTVSWHLRSRQVSLHAGQALFTVSPMIYRPFLVDAGAAKVKVIGTCFNVSRQKDDVRVTVAEGKVNVHGYSNNTTALLLPGQQVRVVAGSTEQTAIVSVEDVLAWQDNRLVFRSTLLSEALDVIQRYSQASITLEDPTLGRLAISGTFNTKRVGEMLEILPSILPLTVYRGENGQVLIKRRPEKNKSPSR